MRLRIVIESKPQCLKFHKSFNSTNHQITNLHKTDLRSMTTPKLTNNLNSTLIVRGLQH